MSDRAGLEIRRILVPTDFSPAAGAAFAHALRIGVALRGQLSLLHAGEQGTDVDWAAFPSVRGTLVRWGMLPAGSARDDVARIGLRVRKTETHGLGPVASILEHVAKEPADLVVLACHRPEGLERWLRREVAHPVARGAGRMTLFVPEGAGGFVAAETGEVLLRSVLVPVDFAPSPQVAVDAAVGLAAALGAEKVSFTVLHVSGKPEMPEVEMREQPGWTWHRVVRSGEPVEEIAALAGGLGADLVSVATRGVDGFLDALRGSTTERVVRRVACPVLATPAA